MNIVVPKDDKVGSVFFDFRDVLGRVEMPYLSDRDGVGEYTHFIPKKYLVYPGEAPTAENVLRHLRERDYTPLSINMDDIKAHLYSDDRGMQRMLRNFKNSMRDVNIYELEQDEKSILVGAPLFRASIQLFEVEVKLNPEGLSRLEEKFLNVENAGACPEQVIEEIVEQSGIRYVGYSKSKTNDYEMQM